MQLFIGKFKIFIFVVLFSMVPYMANSDVLLEKLKISPSEFELKKIRHDLKTFKFVVLKNDKINKGFSDFIPKKREVIVKKEFNNNEEVNKKNFEAKVEERFSRSTISESSFDDLTIMIEEVVSNCSGKLLDLDTAIRKEYSKNIKNGIALNDYALLLTRVLEKEKPFIIELFLSNSDISSFSINFSLRHPENLRKKFKVKMPQKTFSTEEYIPSTNGFEKKIIKTKIIPGIKWFAQYSGNRICEKIASF